MSLDLDVALNQHNLDRQNLEVIIEHMKDDNFDTNIITSFASFLQAIRDQHRVNYTDMQRTREAEIYGGVYSWLCEWVKRKTSSSFCPFPILADISKQVDRDLEEHFDDVSVLDPNMIYSKKLTEYLAKLQSICRKLNRGEGTRVEKVELANLINDLLLHYSDA